MVGQFVTADDYRSEWLMEAMANYVALQRLESEARQASFEFGVIEV